MSTMQRLQHDPPDTKLPSARTGLIANKKQNAANRRLNDSASTEKVGYLRSDGEATFVPWLGFIERRAAKQLDGARAVRLLQITRVGHEGRITDEWSNIPAGHCVHGCLTIDGAYALYDAVVALVDTPEKTRNPRR